MHSQINSIEDLLAFVKSNRKNSGNIHLREWFRGHSNNSYKLHPGIFRKAFKDETERLRQENHLSQDFMIQSALVNEQHNNVERYFLQQHYGMPTRLLDWTSNPLVALFFALDGNDNKDGELFTLDAYQFDINKTRSKFGIATMNNAILKEAIDPCFSWKPLSSYGAKYPSFIIPTRPKHNDSRMVLQSSFFTFHAPGTEILTVKENPSLKSAIIPQNIKMNLKKDLASLGINHYSIYGDLSNLSKKIRFDYDF